MDNRFAVIDIGSNSVRYLGRGDGKRLVTTRLASGLIKTGALAKESMERSVEAIAGFVALACEEGLIPRAYATSAVRDASNGAEFIAVLKREFSLETDVLSGEREAQYALLGAGVREGGALVDIGGGSSQLVTADYAVSFPMGCVRAKDICAGASTLEEMQSALHSRCDSVYRFPRFRIERFTGVGGTITTLAALEAGLSCYDKALVCETVLTQDSVEALIKELYAMGDGARREIPLLHDRHDVIIPGALVLLYIMRGMGIYKMAVSDSDGMEGYRIYINA